MRARTTRTWYPFRGSPKRAYALIGICGSIPVARPSASPSDSRALTLYRGQGVDYALLASHRLPTWHAHNGMLVSIVACIGGSSFDRVSIYGLRSASLRACVLACRSTAHLFLCSTPPGPRDMATRVTVVTASLEGFEPNDDPEPYPRVATMLFFVHYLSTV